MTEYEINPDTFENTCITPIDYSDSKGLESYLISSGSSKDKLSKSLKVNTKTGEFDMACYCQNEYQKESIKTSENYSAQWWVHYLIEQEYRGIDQCYVNSCDEIILDLEYTPVFDDDFGPIDGIYEWGQFALNFSIEDREASERNGKPEYMWFALNLFDTRFHNSPIDLYVSWEHGSGVFLYSLASQTYLPRGVLPIVGENVHINLDIKDLIIGAFNLANERGGMTICDTDNLSIASLNLGFEIQSYRNVGISIHNFGVYYK
jgi:hypothetical protein